MLVRLLVPDTANYMIAGYLVIGVMILGYISSLVLRWRKLAGELIQISSKEQN